MLSSYFKGYFTRDQGVMAKACSVLVAVLLAGNAVIALLGFGIVRIILSAGGAWAFGANTQASIGRTPRMVALAIQVINLLQLLGATALVMLLAESGHRGWEMMPWWLWLLLIGGFTIVGVATADGIRAYSEEE